LYCIIPPCHASGGLLLCWAVFRKWESGDSQFFDLIKAGVKSELEI
jgi:hypothetical protein